MVRAIRCAAVAVITAAWTTVASPLASTASSKCVTIQHQFSGRQDGGDAAKAAAVKAEYRYVWNQYKKQAFPNDELLPITKNFSNGLFGWGASIIDGLDTAIIMGLTDIVEDQLEFIANFKFDHSVGPVNHFDSFIRYIGGLVAAYDLINSPLVPKGTYKQAHVDALLQQAVVISDKLKPGFDTPSGLPLHYYNFTTGATSNCRNFSVPCTDTRVSTAQVGTLHLEWFRLSDLTGDSSYHDLAARAEANLVSPDQDLLFPNLYGTQMDYVTGKFLTKDVGWQGNIDSSYEYMIKSFVYDPTSADTTTYKDYWVGTVDSTISHIVEHPYHRPELAFITMADTNGTILYTTDDYTCFAGGNILLGGQYLDNQVFKDLGYALTDSCHKTFNTSTSGLNPFVSWYNATNQAGDPTAGADPVNRAYAERTGFFIADPEWSDFPEPLESIFYAYRIGGDPRWAAYNWAIFESIIADIHGRIPGVTHGGLTNVTAPRGGDLTNIVQAFYFAEVLKYLYLTFTPASVVSLDEWVFNTEGHPFKIKTGTCATAGS